jgi:predicted acyltransferase
MPEKIHTHLNRLDSIDALRGFDMLMISGGGAFIHLMDGKTGSTLMDQIARQFVHPSWDGFAFYDFIFPLFLFLAGTSLAFSVQIGRKNGLTETDLKFKTFKRMLILIVLGILDKNVPLDIFNPEQIRYGTVLGRIGLATFIGLLFYLRFDWKQRAALGVSLLALYYLAVMWIPVPAFGAGDLSFEGNLIGWFDRAFMPGRLLQKTYDELGLLTQIPACCITLFGTIAGDILSKEIPSVHKLSQLVMLGVVGVGVGLVWSLSFPINKNQKG